MVAVLVLVAPVRSRHLRDAVKQRGRTSSWKFIAGYFCRSIKPEVSKLRPVEDEDRDLV